MHPRHLPPSRPDNDGDDPRLVLTPQESGVNAEPRFIHKDAFNLDLCALLPFAGHCPRLRVLRLYINATEAEIPSSHTPLEPFHALRTLSLGTSQCRLDMGITWTELWHVVEKLLPSLIRLRRDEQEQSHALQEEVEDLRMRNRLLMDKADIKMRDSCIIV